MNDFAVKMMLRQITAEVKTTTLTFSMNGAPKPGTAKMDQIEAKIARWDMRLSVIREKLKSRAGLLHLRSLGTPRGDYAGQQSLKSHAQNISEVEAEAALLAAALAELRGALYGPGSPEKAQMEALSRVLKNISKAKDPGELQKMVQQVPEFRNPSQDGPGGGMVGPGPVDIIMLIAVLISMMKKRR